MTVEWTIRNPKSEIRNPIDHGTVILIEDNPDHALLIQAVLEDSPHVQDVTVIYDGEQALNYIRADDSSCEHRGLPGLVLLDLKLPKIDGLEVLQTIRASPVWHSVPVVILTTSTRPSEIEICYAKGANSYVTKVASPEGLAARVRELAAYWLETATLPD